MKAKYPVELSDGHCKIPPHSLQRKTCNNSNMQFQVLHSKRYICLRIAQFVVKMPFEDN